MTNVTAKPRPTLVRKVLETAMNEQRPRKSDRRMLFVTMAARKTTAA
jgi:hypothetical protein